MDTAGLILADQPHALITFGFRGQELTAYLDPLILGVDGLLELTDNPLLVWQLIEEESRIPAMLADVFNEHVGDLLTTYLDEVGIGVEGYVNVTHGLRNLTDLEVDLLGMGLDIRDWLDLDGDLSTRRVALLVADFLNRPETRIGARNFGINPMDKTGISLTSFLNGFSKDPNYKHPFLQSPEELAERRRQQAEDRAKRERLAAIVPGTVEQVKWTAESFADMRDKSKAALKELLAKRET